MAEAHQRFGAAIFILVALFVSKSADAQVSHSKALEKYMTRDVIGVIYFNIDQLDLDGTIQTATKLGFREQDEVADLAEVLPRVKAEINKLKQAGISRIYALVRSTDVQSLGTSWVMPLKPGSDSNEAKQAVARIVPMLQPGLFAEIDSMDDAVLASATKSQMDQLKNKRPTDSNPRQAMWDGLGNGAIGAMLFGDEDSRRVIRELAPTLPVPFESITGELVADHLAWGGFELNLGKKPSLKIVIEANNEATAATVERCLTQSYALLKQLPQMKQYLPESEFGFVFDSVMPDRNGNRVTVSTAKLTADMDRLAKVLVPQVRNVRIQAAKIARLNTLRQFALGIHNFESAHGDFPTQATIGKNGKPLLSWRVQILPFIEQNELYNQFHLDEPWDSEHNLKLVQQMPEIFEDRNPESRRNNKTGRTIYLGAAGEGTIFNGGKKIKFGNITDGSSNTILIVAAAREHAVPWTKPTDWQVDLKNPAAQFKEAGRTDVEVAFADGSTHRIPVSTDQTTWQRWVQIADGEIVESPR